MKKKRLKHETTYAQNGCFKQKKQDALKNVIGWGVLANYYCPKETSSSIIGAVFMRKFTIFLKVLNG